MFGLIVWVNVHQGVNGIGNDQKNSPLKLPSGLSAIEQAESVQIMLSLRSSKNIHYTLPETRN